MVIRTTGNLIRRILDENLDNLYARLYWMNSALKKLIKNANKNHVLRKLWEKLHFTRK